MVGLSIVFYCTSKTADDAMYYRLTEHIRNYSINSYDLDNVQLHLSCCGVSNFIDWNQTLGFIPGSCCNSNTTCNFDNIVLHRDGCYSALKAFLDNYTEKIIIVLTIIGFIETNLVSNIDTRICVVKSGLKRHTRVKRHISDLKIPVQDGSSDTKSLQGPPTKFVTSYLQPVICDPPLLHIALREIFCLCVVKVQIFLTSEANQQNYKPLPPKYCVDFNVTLINNVDKEKLEHEFRIVSIVSSLLLVYSLKNKGHEESETDEQSVQIPRINNPLGQVTPDPNSSSLSFVIGNVPEDNYSFPAYNYVRRPSERNFIINHRNHHENYLQSPPQQRYDRRIFQSIPKRMNISIYNSQK
ncbi:hypothetical protein PV326_004087 [Microctonus aethiopoides]|nr:hypothetical protein PV326_004087 [Microctonus aethiopoides]